jgi:glycosyltransferase involved in cell wall biosynthesis
MTSTAVAVIVPVYNRASVVLRTLNSVARQTLLPRTLTIVDDGSSDGTAHSVRRWRDSQTLPFAVHIIEQPNRGVSAARNHGFAGALDCEAVGFLDSDDLWPSDFLERACRALHANAAAVAVSCDRLYRDDAGRTAHFDDLSSIAGNGTRWLFEHDGGIASCSLFRTAAICKLGGFNESLRTGEDSELFLRLSLLGPWLYAPGAPTTYQFTLAAERQEQRRLSQAHDDNQRVWALIHEEFALKNGGKAALPASVCRDRLARRWYWAGRQLMMCGRHDEARQCLRRSLSWNAWRHKTWLRLLRSYLPRAA